MAMKMKALKVVEHSYARVPRGLELLSTRLVTPKALLNIQRK